jgi:hypothetical protein
VDIAGRGNKNEAWKEVYFTHRSHWGDHSMHAWVYQVFVKWQKTRKRGIPRPKPFLDFCGKGRVGQNKQLRFAVLLCFLLL